MKKLFLCVLAVALMGLVAFPGTIRLATIAGFYTDWFEEVAAKFTEETGIEVEIVGIDFSILYEKQVMEMAAETAAYDIVTIESTWLDEWAANGWLAPIEEYMTEPERADLAQVSPALMAIGTYEDKFYSVPYYTYTQGMFYRADLFKDPTEMAAFEARYGYPLRPPQSLKEVRDVAEFFTRKPLDTLKGEVLARPFYGVGLMAGRYPHIQDEVMTFMWGLGTQWIKPLPDGRLQVTCNDPIAVRALERYVDLLQFAPPEALNSAYDQVIGQLRDGLIAMTGPMYLDQWPNAVMTEVEVPGAKVAAKASPLAHGYVGAFTLGISVDSPQIREAWQFLGWLSGRDAQMEFAKGGGSTCRMDVLTDPLFSSPEWRMKTGHFPFLHEVLEMNEGWVGEYGLFQTIAAGKIYVELMIACSEAASGAKSPQQALDDLAVILTDILRAYERPGILYEE